MDSTKSRLKGALQSITLFKNKTNIHSQHQSPLFSLPAEIREQIWELALAPAKDSNTPHFHIYDEVYNSCLYARQSKEERQQRKSPVQTALLLTCRAIYHDAKFSLFTHEHFTLVLLAGRARLRDGVGERDSLGSIKKCENLFRRMKRVTLVVQPGAQPDAERYAARVEELLKVMDNMSGVRTLCLSFNFHTQFHTYPSSPQRFQTILSSFSPLDFHENKLFSVHFPSKDGDIQTDPAIVEQYRTLYRSIAGTSYRASLISIITDSRRTPRDLCNERGALGRPISPPPPPRTTTTTTTTTRRSSRGLALLHDTAMIVAALAMVEVYVGCLPVSLGVTYAYLVRHRVKKGEDDIWRPWKSR